MIRGRMAVDVDPRVAGVATLEALISATARRLGDAIALDDGHRTLTFAALEQRVAHAAAALHRHGIEPGERIAVLAENRFEVLELTLAAARVGAILCALNWRFSRAELAHCLRLTSPRLLFVSERHLAIGTPVPDGARSIVFGAEYAAFVAPPADQVPIALAAEAGWIVLYTSGTTGHSKAALISHRAEFARFTLSQIDGGLRPGDGFVAWAPFFHMVALEHALHVLALGGTVHIVDGADIERIVWLACRVPQWWLVLLPGMIDRVVETMAQRGVPPAPIRVVGALADLVPPPLVAETSRVFAAPYWNTFGSTETGMLPFAGTRFAIGERPSTLAKAPNSLHLFKLVDAEDREVVPGAPGEVALRGPTLYSGYWDAETTNARDFRGGWFHLGDVFAARDDGRYDYVDRAKYLIKSGAENVYPAEIERVLLSEPRVLEAAVVRRADPIWGEVPVAFVCCREPAPSAAELIDWCAARLARYKKPKEIRFVAALEDFPRSTSGKIQRQLLEHQLD